MNSLIGPTSSRICQCPRTLSIASFANNITKCFSNTVDPLPPSTSAKTSAKPLESRSWNLKGLRAETTRQHSRTFKKIGKLYEKRDKVRALYDDILKKEKNSGGTSAQIADPEVIEAELDGMRQRLDDLSTLESALKSIKSHADPRFEEAVREASRLGISDMPLQKAAQHDKKDKKPGDKNTQPSHRKPYWVYISQDRIPIRVGRKSEDNDILSCDSAFRHPRNWWLHAAGSAGSHVVIRSTDDALPTKYAGTLHDAALLAAAKSKGGGGRVAVSYVRCRQVSKPRGAPAGLVNLSGDIGTVIVDMRAGGPGALRLTDIMNTRTAAPEDDP